MKSPLLFLLPLLTLTLQEPSFQEVKTRCCNLSKKDPRNCGKFEMPSDLPVGSFDQCKSVFASCCHQDNEAFQCDAGIQAALGIKDCDGFELNKIDHRCCSACTKALEHIITNPKQCPEPGLIHSLEDKAYYFCCRNVMKPTQPEESSSTSLFKKLEVVSSTSLEGSNTHFEVDTSDLTVTTAAVDQTETFITGSPESDPEPWTVPTGTSGPSSAASKVATTQDITTQATTSTPAATSRVTTTSTEAATTTRVTTERQVSTTTTVPTTVTVVTTATVPTTTPVPTKTEIATTTTEASSEMTTGTRVSTTTEITTTAQVTTASKVTREYDTTTEAATRTSNVTATVNVSWTENATQAQVASTTKIEANTAKFQISAASGSHVVSRLSYLFVISIFITINI